MANLKKLSGGYSAMRKKLNELVERVNALSNASVTRSEEEEAGELMKVSGERAILILRSSGDDSAGSADGFQLYFANGNTAFIAMADAFDGYGGSGNWSIKLGVSSGVFTEAYTVDTTADLYDDTGDDQSYWCIPVARDGNIVSVGGAFRADRFCASGGGVNCMLKIG